MSVKWALIGAGRHPILRVAPAFQAVANGELIGVWSHTRANAESLVRQEKIPRVYDTISDVLADADVDAVFISTPNSLHAEHTIAAAQAGTYLWKNPWQFPAQTPAVWCGRLWTITCY
jgi:1,5-anhydro-D-fructose reductase (1,5-anhydro-D-mannitol-forming)